MGTIIGEVGPKFDFSGDDCSLFGALFIVGGILGSVAFGTWVEKSRKYRLSVILIAFFSSVFTLIQYFVLPSGSKFVVSLFCFLQGFVMVPIMAVSFDFGVELTYPIGESYSTGVLMSSGQVFGILYTLISSYLIDKNDKDLARLSYFILTIACSFGFVVSIF